MPIRSFRSSVVALSLLAGIAKAEMPEACKPGGTPEAVAAATGQAGWKVLVSQLAGSTENVAVSGLSLAEAFSLAKAGSTGAVAKDIGGFLGFPDDVDCGPVALAAAWKDLHTKLLSADKSVTLKIANSAWIDPKIHPKKSWLALATRDFGAKVERISLGKPSTVKKINAWVRSNTKQKIEKIVEELSKDDVFVLANAVYFYGPWTTAFDTKNTKNAVFTGTAGAKEIAMMSRDGRFPYAETEEGQFVAIPYGLKHRFELVLHLPKKAGKLEDVVKTLTKEKLDAGLAAMDEAKGVVQLPKFKIDRLYSNLRDTLVGLGMKPTFLFTKDWTTLAPDTDVAVGQVAHRVVLEVEEKGTTMTAATAIVAKTRAAVVETPFEFVANRPFFFFLRERETNVTLAAGAFRTP